MGVQVIPWSTYFTHIYVLALPERRAYMDTVVAYLHIPDVIWLPLVKDADAKWPLTRGDMLCILSHKKAMRDFLRRPDGRRMLVFEDDVQATVPPATLADRLHAMANVPDGAAAYLGRCWSHCWRDTETDIPWLVRTDHSSCMHALSLGRRSAQKLLHAETDGPIDDMLQDLVRAGEVEAFAFKPGLFRQDQTLFSSTAGMPRADRYTEDCKPSYVRLAVPGAIGLICAIGILLWRMASL